MRRLISTLGAAALIGVAASPAMSWAADDSHSYTVPPLVSNLSGAKRDQVLQNAWGVAFSPAGSPFWVNDNATGCSTLYEGTGAKITALQVSIPLPGNIVPV